MPRTVKPKKEHPIKDLLSHFDQAHRLRFGQPYRVIGGRDAKTAMNLLSFYAFADLCRWADAFFVSPDPFIRGGSYTFAFFGSQIGKLIAAEAPGVTLKPKNIRTLQGIYGN